jgi:hypothetical protein
VPRRRELRREPVLDLEEEREAPQNGLGTPPDRRDRELTHRRDSILNDHFGASSTEPVGEEGGGQIVARADVRRDDEDARAHTRRLVGDTPG